jgi:16S rRNA (uracil1498-N3)-methyltransferase
VVSARFFCPDPPRDGRLRLSPEESRHLTRVCRLDQGDHVEVFDGRGFVACTEVLAIRAEGVELAIVGEPIPERRSPGPLTLATAVPKADRFDWLVEKATELGVERLIPLITERSVVAPRGSKLSRLRRAIIEASKQCRRDRLMILDEPTPWSALAKSSADALRFLADPHGRPPGQWPAIPRGRALVLAVGPEGGFTAPERALANRTGWIPINLGLHTLRIETAGLAGSIALISRIPDPEG